MTPAAAQLSVLPAAGSAISRSPSRCFAFGNFVLSPEKQLLSKAGMPVRIGGRAFDLLATLVERPGELLDKHELIARVWPDRFVDDANLKVNMVGLRKALGETPASPQYIATVVGRGYRFIAPVRQSHLVAMLSEGHSAETKIAGMLNAIEAVRKELQLFDLIAPDVRKQGALIVRCGTIAS